MKTFSTILLCLTHIKCQAFKIDYSPNVLVKSNPIIQQWSYSDFVERLKMHQVESATILENAKGFVAIDNLHESGTDPSGLNLHAVSSYPDLTNKAVELLQANSVPFDVLNQASNGGGNPITLLFNLFIGYMFLNIVFRQLLMLSGRGGTGTMPSINPFEKRSSDMEITQPGEITQRFSDVAGIDSIKNEVVEVVEYLKNSDKYLEMGAKVPKGVLLEGPPGVGKTLLARATAGEAGVPFISVSGSQFIEMFVGVGASRVRNVFETARSFEKCIVFIDEIDAVGKQRGGSGITGGGNDEREQTLNQILTEMDGFKISSGIIVMAATNRIDLLDSALVRPGRFDRKISVPLPNAVARKQIIKTLFPTYTSEDEITELVSLTSGFSGASIANLINEALIFAIRNNRTEPSQADFLDAFEKIQIGLPVENNNLDYETKELVAYHEAGHTLISLYFNNTFRLSRATIKPTSNGAGGYTLFTPNQNFVEYPNKKYLLAQMILAMGGKAAEEILYRNKKIESEDIILKNNKDLFVTSGAVSDLQQVNQLAETYITKVGFGTKLNGYSSETYLSSEYVKSQIDKEKQQLISNAYNQAVTILENNLDNLQYIAEYLIVNQTMIFENFRNSINYIS
jgi:cell division protease FtsH